MRASLGAWIVSCVVLSLVLSAEATRYVSPTGGNIPPYNTWARAARDIQTAVNAAANGELVLVNNGTYALPATLTVSRGIILRSANVLGATIQGSSTFRCINLTGNGVVENFNITQGRAPGNDGGGVYIDGSGTVRGCRITRCSAGLSGGGVVIRSGGLLENSEISNCHGDDEGGGVALQYGGTVRNCNIFSNTLYGSALNWGGGVGMRGAGLVEYCKIWDNSTEQNGGGVHLYQGGEVRNCVISGNVGTNRGGGVAIIETGMVKRCLIRDNKTVAAWPEGKGGGVYIEGGQTFVENCRIEYNYASDRGGGVATSGGGTINSALIRGNTALYYGGGVCMENGGYMMHGTVVWNTAIYMMGGGTFCQDGGTTYNSIIYYNTAGFGSANINDGGTGGFYNYCCTPSVPAHAGTIFQGAPGFRDMYLDFRLSPTSPLYDACIAAWTAADYDMQGNPRITGFAPDCGAYEYCAPANDDLNADGTAELKVYDRGTWYTKILASDQEWNNAFGYPGVTPLPARFNKNNRGDEAVYDPSVGMWYVLLDDGSAPLWANNWGFRGTRAVAGDYDGSGIDDFAVWDTNTGNWYIRAPYGNFNIALGFNFGWRGAIPVSGDYDGDGRSDLAIYHPPTGMWYIWSLANGAPIVWGRQWGFSGCEPVSGDFDGDGCSDLALFHAATGKWYLRTASEYPITGADAVLLVGYNLGYTGCVPMAGDYDADGMDDMAVYATAARRFYIVSLRWGALAWGVSCGSYPGVTSPQPVKL